MTSSNNCECLNAIAFFDKNSSFNSAQIYGKITFHQCSSDHKTIIKFNLHGIEPNTVHGIHIHKSGDLTKGCESLCEHYNPYKRLHGSQELYGSSRHVGDLINNLYADKDGSFIFEYLDELVDLYGNKSIIGRSIVIHAGVDDLGLHRNEKTKLGELSRTTGNSGSRISCALIGISYDNYGLK